jgi:hypothetical protein
MRQRPHRKDVIHTPQALPGGPRDGPPAGKESREGESLVTDFYRGWEGFWFSKADPTTLGFIRICAGILILYVHLSYSFGLMSYVGGDRAWLDKEAVAFIREQYPVEVYVWHFPSPYVTSAEQDPIYYINSKGSYSWSPFFHIDDPFWIVTLHIGFLVAMTLFTLGLWTRVTSVLTWFGVVSYIQRASTLLFGMDSMMVLVILYLMLSPCGDALSLDRWLQWRRGRKLAGPSYQLPPPEPSVSANFALRCLQLNFCIIYLAAGTSKLLGSLWWNGTALWNCFANYSFAPMGVGIYYETLVFLCRHRWLWELAMTGSAIFTLMLELGVPFVIWSPRLRWLGITGAVLLHTGIGLFMGLTTFSMFMLCMVAAFLPPEAIRYLAKEVRDQTGKLLPFLAGQPQAGKREELVLSR